MIRGPDFQLSDGNDPLSYITGARKCSALIPCFNSLTGSVVGTLANGQCKCSGDFYDVVGSVNTLGDAKFGSCVSGCSAKICNAHGQCTPDPRGTTTYNSICSCNTGFTTSTYRADRNAQTPEKSNFDQRLYCDVPYDPQDASLPRQITCGRYGEERKFPDTNGYMCQVKKEWEYLQGLLSVNPATQLYRRSCGRSENPVYRDLTCGGSGRGICVSDGRQGSLCQCSNGFKGVACDELVCPVRLYVNGGVCSGNGYCDNPTLKFDDPVAVFDNQLTAFKASAGRCVCKSGFIGDACEKVRLDCSVGQTQRNYPLLQNITNIVSDQQLTAYQP